jgi:NADH:ubiquinone oxidoreductase subunit E
VAALKRVSQVSGAAYALIYGTATYYSHLRFEKPGHTVVVCMCTACLVAGSNKILGSLAKEFETEIGRRPAPGGMALELVPSHVPGASSPLIILDGKPQQVTASSAATWATKLLGKSAA